MFLVVSYQYIESHYYTENKKHIDLDKNSALEYACEFFKQEWRKRARYEFLYHKYDFDFPFNKSDTDIDGVKVYEYDTTFSFKEIWHEEIEYIDIYRNKNREKLTLINKENENESN